jgi:hypothetical protein
MNTAYALWWNITRFWMKLTDRCTQCGVKHPHHKMDCGHRYEHLRGTR